MKQNLPMLATLLPIAYAINSCSDRDVPDLPPPCGDFGYYNSETYYCYTELRQRCDSAGNCDVLYSTCFVAEKPGNSAYYVMTCGTTTAEWPKAMCEAKAYDPETHICSGGTTLIPACGGVVYDEDTHFCDTRDKTVYAYKKIGEQTWMAENLNYDASGSKCYDNAPANCNTYGRLYNYETAMNGIQGVCPSRWHIPSDAEWTTLTDFAGGSSTAATKLKAKSGWDSNGTDDYGFSAMPGGYGDSSGSFYYIGSEGGWWSTSEDGGSTYRFGLYVSDKSNLFSVRCVKN
jgi:uncharacterized protein (TIGR02145 family)